MLNRLKISKCIKLIIKPDRIFPLAVRLIAHSIKPHYISPAEKGRLRLLIFDFERWWPDDVMALSRYADIYIFPTNLRQRILGFFLNDKDISCFLRNDFNSFAEKKKERCVQFLSKMFSWLKKNRNFKNVITINYKYIQNRPFIEACRAADVAFTCLFKECMKEPLIGSHFKKKYILENRDMRFLGKKLLVYNEQSKEFLIDIGAADPKKIDIVGSPKFDIFFKKVQSVRPTADTCVLFSFRHKPPWDSHGIYQQQFSEKGQYGFVHLFNQTHESFAHLAQRNPNVQFVIKLKWSGVWINYVNRSVKNAIGGKWPCNLKIITNQVSAQDLILRSIAVTGLNSTTLLESLIARVPVIYPYFEEASGRYKDYLQFQDLRKKFLIAGSKNEFEKKFQKCINAPYRTDSISDPIIEKYFGYTDGQSAERIMQKLYEINQKVFSPMTPSRKEKAYAGR